MRNSAIGRILHALVFWDDDGLIELAEWLVYDEADVVVCGPRARMTDKEPPKLPRRPWQKNAARRRDALERSMAQKTGPPPLCTYRVSLFAEDQQEPGGLVEIQRNRFTVSQRAEFELPSAVQACILDMVRNLGWIMFRTPTLDTAGIRDRPQNEGPRPG